MLLNNKNEWIYRNSWHNTGVTEEFSSVIMRSARAKGLGEKIWKIKSS